MDPKTEGLDFSKASNQILATGSETKISIHRLDTWTPQKPQNQFLGSPKLGLARPLRKIGSETKTGRERESECPESEAQEHRSAAGPGERCA